MVPVAPPEATDEIGLFCPKWADCVLGNISQQYGQGGVSSPAESQTAGGTGHAHLGRPLRARSTAPRAGVAIPDTRGAHPDDPRLDGTQRRSYPQTLQVLSRPRRLLCSPSPRQVAAPVRLLHPLAEDPTGSSGAGELFCPGGAGA